MMRTMSLAGTGAFVVATLLLAGCVTPEGAATQTDFDALRSEIADLRARIDSGGCEGREREGGPYLYAVAAQVGGESDLTAGITP